MKEKHRKDSESLRHFTFSRKSVRSLRPKFVYSGILHKQSGWEAPEHLHDCCEILYVRAGSGRIRTGGKAYAVQSGDLVVYDPEIAHGEHSDPDNPLECLFVAAAGIRLHGLKPGRLLAPDAPPVLHTGEYQTVFDRLFSELVRESSEQALFYKEISENLLSSIVHLILRLAIRNTDLEEINDVYSRVKNYLDAHYAEKLTLDGICERFFVSKSYLSHVFKELNGESPMRYLAAVRLNRAKAFLRETDLPVREIAERSGYPDACYFSRLFRSAEGCTPLAYRKGV